MDLRYTEILMLVYGSVFKTADSHFHATNLITEYLYVVRCKEYCLFGVAIDDLPNNPLLSHVSV